MHLAFWDKCQSYEGTDNAIEGVREYLASLNSTCPLRNTELLIASPAHHIDWSYGETEGRIALEEVPGKFEGLFIGYLVLPSLIGIDAVVERPTLSTVLKTTLYDPEIDHYSDIIVITPIPTAEITFL